MLDIRELARRHGVGVRKVKEALEDLHPQGLPRFADGDEISKEWAEIISEFGFGTKLPHRHRLNVDQPPDGVEHRASKEAVPGDQDSWDDWNDVRAKLEKTSRAGPTEPFFNELRRLGFRLGGDRGYHVFPRCGSEKHILRQTRWDPAVDVPKLLKFVARFRWPGMYCETCSEWFVQEDLEKAAETGSKKYAFTEGYRRRCLGCCGQAIHWANKHA